MSRRRNQQLPELSQGEQEVLQQIARSPREAANPVARAKTLLAVAADLSTSSLGGGSALG